MSQNVIVDMTPCHCELSLRNHWRFLSGTKASIYLIFFSIFFAFKSSGFDQVQLDENHTIFSKWWNSHKSKLIRREIVRIQRWFLVRDGFARNGSTDEAAWAGDYGSPTTQNLFRNPFVSRLEWSRVIIDNGETETGVKPFGSGAVHTHTHFVALRYTLTRSLYAFVISLYTFCGISLYAVHISTSPRLAILSTRKSSGTVSWISLVSCRLPPPLSLAKSKMIRRRTKQLIPPPSDQLESWISFNASSLREVFEEQAVSLRPFFTKIIQNNFKSFIQSLSLREIDCSVLIRPRLLPITLSFSLHFSLDRVRNLNRSLIPSASAVSLSVPLSIRFCSPLYPFQSHPKVRPKRMPTTCQCVWR